MMQAARTIPCKSTSGQAARFEVCNAENLSTLANLAPESVDLITAGTAAHWFNLPQFYAAATKVLRLGGSIALWCHCIFYSDPNTTPNAEGVRAVLQKFQVDIVGPYPMPGNKHCNQLYASLDLPWEVNTTDPVLKAALATFDDGASHRCEFNRDGVPDERFEGGFVNRATDKIEYLKIAMGTASFVTRWRAAHKEELEKGENVDCGLR
jgi:trans-aconitate 3-methyltransferase